MCKQFEIEFHVQKVRYYNVFTASNLRTCEGILVKPIVVEQEGDFIDLYVHFQIENKENILTLDWRALHAPT